MDALSRHCNRMAEQLDRIDELEATVRQSLVAAEQHQRYGQLEEAKQAEGTARRARRELSRLTGSGEVLS